MNDDNPYWIEEAKKFAGGCGHRYGPPAVDTSLEDLYRPSTTLLQTMPYTPIHVGPPRHPPSSPPGSINDAVPSTINDLIVWDEIDDGQNNTAKEEEESLLIFDDDDNSSSSTATTTTTMTTTDSGAGHHGQNIEAKFDEIATSLKQAEVRAREAENTLQREREQWSRDRAAWQAREQELKDRLEVEMLRRQGAQDHVKFVTMKLQSMSGRERGGRGQVE